MESKLRARFWIESGLTLLTGALMVLTLFLPNWIEVVFGIDPDEGSGSLEWLVVAVLLTLTIVFAMMARSEWRRRGQATA